MTTLAFAGMTLILILSMCKFSTAEPNQDPTPTPIPAPTSTERVQWTLDETYQGDHMNSFQRLRYEVTPLMRQTMIDMAVRLGMDFNEGWRYPMTVKFVDGSPMGVENVLAYVELGQTPTGFSQTLNINLAAYDIHRYDFKPVFAHELVHAMFNDSMDGDAARKLPVWLHEGLAVYGSGEGDDLVKRYVYMTTGFSELKILNGLEGPHGALDYAEDYLAIKYIYDAHGVNVLHNFVRETILRDGNYKAAMDYTFHESWEDFQANARKYSADQIRQISSAPHESIYPR